MINYDEILKEIQQQRLANFQNQSMLQIIQKQEDYLFYLKNNILYKKQLSILNGMGIRVEQDVRNSFQSSKLKFVPQEIIKITENILHFLKIIIKVQSFKTDGHSQQLYRLIDLVNLIYICIYLIKNDRILEAVSLIYESQAEQHQIENLPSAAELNNAVKIIYVRCNFILKSKQEQDYQSLKS